MKNSNLAVTAWDGEKVVGIPRSMTDFCYLCYLSDLSVDESYQRIEIDRKIVLIH